MVQDVEKIMLVVGLGYEFGIGLLLQYIPIPGIGRVKSIFSRMDKTGLEAARTARESGSSGIVRTMFAQMIPSEHEGSEPPLSDSIVAQEAVQDIVRIPVNLNRARHQIPVPGVSRYMF
jgi:hypothetical protein